MNLTIILCVFVVAGKANGGVAVRAAASLQYTYTHTPGGGWQVAGLNANPTLLFYPSLCLPDLAVPSTPHTSLPHSTPIHPPTVTVTAAY